MQPGETADLPLDGEAVSGWGVRFAPIEPGDLWRLRCRARPYGHEGYAPSGRFSIGERSFTLVSGGDDLVELAPPGAPGVLRLTAGATGATIRREADGAGGASAARIDANPWARGAWLGGSWRGLDQARVETDLAALVDSRLDFCGRVVDFGWQDYDADPFQPNQAFRDLSGLVSRHRDAGLAVSLWIGPWIPVGSGVWNVLDRRGWFVEQPDGGSYVFPVVSSGAVFGSYLDLTKEDVYRWWVGGVGQLRALGVRGVKLDFGEALPFDAVLAAEVPRQDGIPWTRNSYPLAMQTGVREGLGADGFVMARSGWTGSERLVANWPGDQTSDLSPFTGVPSALQALRSALDSGYGAVGVDIGGYFGSPNDEAFLASQRSARLFDFAVYHGLTGRQPWRRSAVVQRAHQDLVKVLRSGWDAASRVVLQASRVGVIAQREGEDVIAVGDVGEPMAVRLPEGRWTDVRTGADHDGPILVACDAGSVFRRSDRRDVALPKSE